MPPNTSRHDRFPPAPKSPPRLRTSYARPARAASMTCAQAYETWRRFGHPFPKWMGVRGWYDHALGALCWLSVAAACISYVRHRLRAARAGRPPVPRPWHLRREVRLVLYVTAVAGLIQLPLAVYLTVAALNGPAPPPFANPLVDVFLPGGLIGPLVGMAIVLYDRGRASREEREAGNLCLVCGYD